MADLDGFEILNSAEAAPDYWMAEPDRADFIMLGNDRYGVVSGCEPSINGADVTIAPGWVVVNGYLYQIGGGAVASISTASGTRRFDLIVYSPTAGGVTTLTTQSDESNPVFPAIQDDSTVLAAVYTYGNVHRLIDKRKRLPNGLLASGLMARDFIVSKDENGTTKFRVRADGKMWWNEDTSLARTAPGTLRVYDRLEADAVDADTSMTVNGYNVLTDEWLKHGPTANRPVTPEVGWIYVSTTDGSISVCETAGQWSTVATFPAGAIVATLGATPGNGWTRLDGTGGNPDFRGVAWMKPTVANSSTYPPASDLTLESPATLYFYVKN